MMTMSETGKSIIDKNEAAGAAREEMIENLRSAVEDLRSLQLPYPALVAARIKLDWVIAALGVEPKPLASVGYPVREQGASECNGGEKSYDAGREVYIRFDGPPGPVAPRFVEVEDGTGRSIKIGRWEADPDSDGDWFLIILASEEKGGDKDQ